MIDNESYVQTKSSRLARRHYRADAVTFTPTAAAGAVVVPDTSYPRRPDRQSSVGRSAIHHAECLAKLRVIRHTAIAPQNRAAALHAGRAA